MDHYQYSNGDKTSVKVHHQPGGNSSFSIGWGNDPVPNNGGRAQVKGFNAVNQSQPDSYQPKQQQQQYSNQPARGGNVYPDMYSQKQNQQQQQQSAWGQPQTQPKYRQAQDGGITSVKVHQTPGGNQSLNIFGGQDEQQNNAQRFERNQNNFSNQKQAYQQQPTGVQWGSQQQQQQQPWDQQQELDDRINRWNKQSEMKSQVFHNEPQPQYNQQPQLREQQQWQPQTYAQRERSGGNDIFQQNQFRDQNQFQQQQNQYQQRQQPQGYGNPQAQDVFGKRVESGENHSAISGISSVKLHAPPGGRSQIQLF